MRYMFYPLIITENLLSHNGFLGTASSEIKKKVKHHYMVILHEITVEATDTPYSGIRGIGASA